MYSGPDRPLSYLKTHFAYIRNTLSGPPVFPQNFLFRRISSGYLACIRVQIALFPTLKPLTSTQFPLLPRFPHFSSNFLFKISLYFAYIRNTLSGPPVFPQNFLFRRISSGYLACIRVQIALFPTLKPLTSTQFPLLPRFPHFSSNFLFKISLYFAYIRNTLSGPPVFPQNFLFRRISSGYLACIRVQIALFPTLKPLTSTQFPLLPRFPHFSSNFLFKISLYFAYIRNTLSGPPVFPQNFLFRRISSGYLACIRVQIALFPTLKPLTSTQFPLLPRFPHFSSNFLFKISLYFAYIRNTLSGPPVFPQNFLFRRISSGYLACIRVQIALFPTLKPLTSTQFPLLPRFPHFSSNFLFKISLYFAYIRNTLSGPPVFPQNFLFRRISSGYLACIRVQIALFPTLKPILPIYVTHFQGLRSFPKTSSSDAFPRGTSHVFGSRSPSFLP